MRHDEPPTAALPDLVRAAVDHFNRGDVDGYLAAFADSCPHLVAGLAEPLGFDDFAAVMRELRAGLPDCRIDEVHLGVADRFVTARWQTTGTHTAPMFGIHPTHRRVAFDSIEVYEVGRTGLVKCSWIFGDPVALLSQIG